MSEQAIWCYQTSFNWFIKLDVLKAEHLKNLYHILLFSQSFILNMDSNKPVPDYIILTQWNLGQLEELERLGSEDTPRRLTITHTIESYWIRSQKKTKSKLQIKKIRQNLKFFNFETGITRFTSSEVAW